MYSFEQLDLTAMTLFYAWRADFSATYFSSVAGRYFGAFVFAGKFLCELHSSSLQLDFPAMHSFCSQITPAS
jgi:hypothetical protein